MNEGNLPLRAQSNLPGRRIGQVANGTKNVYTRVNDDTRDRGSVTSDPLGGTVHCENVRKYEYSYVVSTDRQYPRQGKLAGSDILPFQTYCRLSTGCRCHGQSNTAHRASWPMGVPNMQSAYLGKLWYRGNVVFGVANTLDINRSRLLIDGGRKVLWVISVDELDTDAIFLERHCGLSATTRLGWVDGSNL